MSQPKSSNTAGAEVYVDRLLAERVSMRTTIIDLQAERDRLRTLLDEAASIIDEHAPGYTVWRQTVDEYFQEVRK